jgi:hypothetical protein
LAGDGTLPGITTCWLKAPGAQQDMQQTAKTIRLADAKFIVLIPKASRIRYRGRP